MQKQQNRIMNVLMLSIVDVQRAKVGVNFLYFFRSEFPARGDRLLDCQKINTRKVLDHCELE